MKTTKLLVFPATIIVSVLVFSYLIKPEWDSYSDNKLKLLQEEEILEKAKNSKSKFDKVSADYNSLDFDKKKLFQEAVPNYFSQEVFLYSLNAIISEVGVVLDSINFSENSSEKTEESFLNHGVKLSVEGNFFQIKKFIYLIENMNRFVEVEKISLSKGDDLNKMQASLSLIIFSKNKTSIKETLNVKDPYFEKLLNSGLETAVLDDYQRRTGNPKDFDLSFDGQMGKENLFNVEKSSKENPPANLSEESQDEVDDLSVEEIETDNIEENPENVLEQ